MGNRLSLGGGGGNGEYFDDSSLGDEFSDSSLDNAANSSGADGAAANAAASEFGGQHNLAFAPSLKDLSARAVAAASGAPSPSAQPHHPPPSPPNSERKTRICPIVQNGRQITKDFYWVLPERTRQPVALETVADEDEYQNLGGQPRSAPPKPPPRRICRSESSGAGISNPKHAARSCRRTASSVSGSSPSSAAAAALASACVPHQWRQSLLLQVQRSVPGVSDDECRLALGLNSGDSELASRYLKVEQLFRLGLAERGTCLSELQTANWCLETAGAALADRVSG